MALPSGSSAIIVRSHPTRYESGVYSIARTIRDILTAAFFYQRSAERLRSGELSGLEYEQTQYLFDACYTLAVIGLRSLVDKDDRDWSFGELFRLWKLFDHTPEQEQAISTAIARLTHSLDGQKTLWNERIAHRSKTYRMNDLTFPPDKIGDLQEIVDLMDLFVSGPIPYTLYLSDTSEELDLRALLNLTSPPTPK